MSKLNRWEQVTEKASEVNPNWTSKEKAQFEYYNPNGIYKKSQNHIDSLRLLVDFGALKSGWLLADNLTSNHFADCLRKYATEKKRVNSLSLEVTIKLMKERLEKAENSLNEEREKQKLNK
ncbi:MAG: hypothetical protein GY804_03805 [Alphaproteobacteria bacterium]|nr:hypothetical protein [Alphaproteobacteria bacterium]